LTEKEIKIVEEEKINPKISDKYLKDND